MTCHNLHSVSWPENAIYCTSDRSFRCFYLFEMFPTQGKDKNRTAARRKTSDINVILKWRHNLMSHLSVFRNFWNPFWNMKMHYSMVSKKNNPLIVWGGYRKIRLLGSPFVITRQASWCQSVILMMDFSILPSASLVMPVSDCRARFFYPTLRKPLDANWWFSERIFLSNP